jgi:hypothetical protein
MFLFVSGSEIRLRVKLIDEQVHTGKEIRGSTFILQLNWRSVFDSASPAEYLSVQ